MKLRAEARCFIEQAGKLLGTASMALDEASGYIEDGLGQRRAEAAVRLRENIEEARGSLLDLLIEYENFRKKEL